MTEVYVDYNGNIYTEYTDSVKNEQKGLSTFEVQYLNTDESDSLSLTSQISETNNIDTEIEDNTVVTTESVYSNEKEVVPNELEHLQVFWNKMTSIYSNLDRYKDVRELIQTGVLSYSTNEQGVKTTINLEKALELHSDINTTPKEGLTIQSEETQDEDSTSTGTFGITINKQKQKGYKTKIDVNTVKNEYSITDYFNKGKSTLASHGLTSMGENNLGPNEFSYDLRNAVNFFNNTNKEIQETEIKNSEKNFKTNKEETDTFNKISTVAVESDTERIIRQIEEEIEISKREEKNITDRENPYRKAINFLGGNITAPASPDIVHTIIEKTEEKVMQTDLHAQSGLLSKSKS